METDTKQELFSKIKSRGFRKEVPARYEKPGEFIRELFQLLFPAGNDCLPEALQLEQSYLNVAKLFYELQRSSVMTGCCNEVKTNEALFKQLPAVHDLLYEDAEAIYNGDPAANSREEVIHTYPGFYAIFIHRIAHAIYLLKMPLQARMLSEYAHSVTGIDIHPGAKIGRFFSIDHGTGIVIGETTIIGEYVKIYQGVTLGAKSVDKNLATKKRHPTIENHVIIYANATILGGETIIGKNSTIGGNVFLTRSVPENSLVYQKSNITIKPLLFESGHSDNCCSQAVIEPCLC